MATADFEVITPEMAKKMLEQNVSNFRSIDARRVAKYAREMRRGAWEVNGEAIKFNGSSLLDGQHRLTAIVESGCSIKTLVIRGVTGSGRSLDRGKPRTISQWLKHAGYKNASDLASAGRLCVAYDMGKWTEGFSSKINITDSEIFDFVEAFNEPLQEAIKIGKKAKPIAPVSVIAALLFNAAEKKDASQYESCHWFVKGLATGVDLTETDAVLHLRNRLMKVGGTEVLTPFFKRMVCTTAWNRTAAGLPTKAIDLRLHMTGPRKSKLPNHIEVVEELQPQY
jgi:hypothetical protein